MTRPLRAPKKQHQTISLRETGGFFIAQTAKMYYGKTMHDLIIMGQGNGWRDIVSEEARDVWAVLSVYSNYKHADKYFDIHKMTNAKLERLREIIPEEKLFRAEAFPHADLIKQFGPVFHSSVSWMLGYACLLGYTDIKMIGVNMEHGTEYGSQRDSYFYMVGNLAARGVTVYTDRKSGVYLSTEMYGGV